MKSKSTWVLSFLSLYFALVAGNLLVGSVFADDLPISAPITAPVADPTPTPLPVTSPISTNLVSQNTGSSASTHNVLQPAAPTYNTQAPVCNDQKPGQAPVLLSAVVSDKNQVTLTWNKAENPITYYLVAYGTKPGILEYGNPNVGDKNTTRYTVQGLSGGKTYYFKVRAGNNCMPGSFSNEIAVQTSGAININPAVGFTKDVLGVDKTKNTQEQFEAELQYKPIGTTQPQRLISSTLNLFGTIFSLITGLIQRI